MAVSKEEKTVNETVIKQIPISNSTVNEYRHIVTLLAKEGYEISDSLKEIRDDEYITAILIDNDRKRVFQLGPALTAAWCGGERYPLNAEQFSKCYDQLITHPDPAFYEQRIHTEHNSIYASASVITVL